jgi:hypothetical protein
MSRSLKECTMNRRSHRSLLLALAITAFPAGLAAQQRDAKAAPAPVAKDAQAQAWLSELQVLNAKLEALQARALQDPQLMAAQQALGGSIKTEMNRIDPTLDQSLARGKELETQAMAAQKKGDDATLRQLAEEMQQIQQRFFSVQQKVVQQPALATQLKSFQDRVQKRMTALDATTPTMIARFTELQGKLANAMKAAGN